MAWVKSSQVDRRDWDGVQDVPPRSAWSVGSICLVQKAGYGVKGPVVLVED